MADVHGFKDLHIARRLKRMAMQTPLGRQGKNWIPGQGADSIMNVHPSMTIHIGVLSTEVSAAVFVPEEIDSGEGSPYYSSPYYGSPYFGGGGGGGGGGGFPAFTAPGSGTAILYRKAHEFIRLEQPSDVRTNSPPVQTVTVYNFMRTSYPADLSPGTITPNTKYYYILEDAEGIYWLLPPQVTLMLCTATAASGTGIPTVLCSVANQFYGEPPGEQPFQVTKLFADQVYAIGDKLIVFGDKDSPTTFYGFSPGGGGGGVAIYKFVLIEDKGATDHEALAHLYTYTPEDGFVRIEDEDENPLQVYVLDYSIFDDDIHVGYAAYVDPQFGAQEGYSGLCYHLKDDYASGKPAYAILTMEERCRYIEARVPTSLENPGGFSNIAIIENFWDGRPPKTVLQVYDSTPLVGVPFIDSQSLFGTRNPNSKMKLVWDAVRSIDIIFAVKHESSEGMHAVQGYLNTDLTTAMATVQMTVSRSSDVGLPAGTILTCNNPIDELLGGSPRRLFIGNTDSYAEAIRFGEDYWLTVVQPPIKRPIAPP